MARVSAGVLAGLAAGIVAGLGARLAMRMVALGVADGVGITPDFTIGGTLVIVVTGMILGAAAGLAFGLVADRLPGPRPLRGLVFAAILLAVIGPFFFRIEEFFSAGRVLLFLPLFLVFGTALGLMFVPVRTRFAREG